MITQQPTWRTIWEWRKRDWKLYPQVSILYNADIIIVRSGHLAEKWLPRHNENKVAQQASINKMKIQISRSLNFWGIHQTAELHRMSYTVLLLPSKTVACQINSFKEEYIMGKLPGIRKCWWILFPWPLIINFWYKHFVYTFLCIWYLNW